MPVVAAVIELSVPVDLLQWPRTQTAGRASAEIRHHHADFQVEEVLGFTLAEEGEHVFLFIEKRGLNSKEVASSLARLAGVSERDIGYSGLKDKHAQTRQWFSVGMAGKVGKVEKAEPNWASLENEQLRILSVNRHLRKIRRGIHKANLFSLQLRNLRGDRDELLEHLQRIRQRGVPNYFGEQRFGYQAGNIRKGFAWIAGEIRAPKRHQRGLILSSLRALLFNELLAARVRSDSWEVPACGDMCALNGSGSIFVNDGSDPTIAERASERDLHLALPLWGDGEAHESPRCANEQSQVLAAYQQACEFLCHQGLRRDYRPARVIADDFCWQFCDDDQLTISFSLPAGSFATTVLRELLDYRDMSVNRGNTVG